MMERASRERLRKERKEARRQSTGTGRERSRLQHKAKERGKRGQTAHEGDSDDEETSSLSREKNGEDEKMDTEILESDEDDVIIDSSPPGSVPQAEKPNFPEREARVILDDAQKKLEEKLGREDCPSVRMDRKEDGQGRKAETGEHYIKRLNKAKNALMAEAETLRALRAGMAPDSLSNNRRAVEKKLEEELSNAPTVTLPSQILEAVNGVDMVARKSTRLKGEYTGTLNRSAAMVKVAISHLVQRHDSVLNPHAREAEMDRLRQKIAEQEREIESLRQLKLQHDTLKRELEEQREQMNRLKETVLGRTDVQETYKDIRGAKRKKVNQFPSSSDEDNEPPRWEEEMGETRLNEDNQHQGTEGMETVGEEESAVSRRNEIMREVETEGMPAALRPSLRGQRAILDPEVPPTSTSTPPSVTKRDQQPLLGRLPVGNMETRLADMLVRRNSHKFLEGAETRKNLPQRKEKKPQTKSEETEEERKGKKGRKRVEVARKNPSIEGTKEEASKIGTQNRAAGVPSSVQANTGQPEGGLWSQVIGRKERTAEKKKERQQQERRRTVPATAQQQQQKQPKRREPRTSAVTLTCPPGMYAEHMGAVRQAINLKDLGIDKPPNTRRTATGALSIELTGQGSAEKADALAAKMGEVLAGKEGVKVARPTMTADIRLSGFDESVTTEEIGRAVAEITGTHPSCVAVGPISQGPRGMGTTVVKCPVKTANVVAKEGKVVLGWTRAKADVLTKRPLQYYRCLEVGHTRVTCRNEIDRTGVCYRCGGQGHVARGCEAKHLCTAQCARVTAGRPTTEWAARPALGDEEAHLPKEEKDKRFPNRREPASRKEKRRRRRKKEPNRGWHQSSGLPATRARGTS
ncbi:hypothetical protein DBV15_12876 [Temnothorax longispinosus]|uniref:CCHC-type domain-containing protein n=1 Tax=Temnothorax longispinosus TaxID=300112 RepID=A0A4V3SAG7_9HYME|nr:hypothetical protein DBV15_12876 [Temnothorax longispinosus]